MNANSVPFWPGLASLPLRMLFPAVCPCCDEPVESEERGTCHRCWRNLVAHSLAPDGRCSRCYQARGPGKSLTDCGYCGGRQIFFTRHRSLYPMQGGWRELLHRWKFENDRRLWRVFWPACSSAHVLAELAGAGIERVTWIDSGRSGRDYRNYQPCADVARALAARLQVSAGPDLRKRARRNQSGRGYADRFYAVHDSLAFVGPVRHSRWLLLEDVFTTGATANEAARILKKNGALSVFVLSLLLRPGTVR